MNTIHHHHHRREASYTPAEYSFPNHGTPIGSAIEHAVAEACGFRPMEIQPDLWRAESSNPLNPLVVTVSALPIDGRHVVRITMARRITLLGGLVGAALFVSVVGWFALIFGLIVLSGRDAEQRQAMLHGILRRLAGTLGEPSATAARLPGLP